MSRRHGGLVKNFKGFKDDWSSVKSPSSSASAPVSITNLRYTDAGGIWTINSTSEFPKAQTGSSDFSIVGQTTSASNGANNSGTTTAVTTPAGTASGDILLLVIGSGSSTINSPAGWTLAASSTTSLQTAYVYYRILSAAPATSYAFTQQSISVINASLISIRKAAGSVSFGSATVTTDSSLSTVVYPSITTTASSMVLPITFVRGSTTTGVNVPNLPTPYAEVSEIINTTSTSNSRMLMVEYFNAGIETLTPPTKTLPETTTGVVAMTLAIR